MMWGEEEDRLAALGQTCAVVVIGAYRWVPPMNMSGSSHGTRGSWDRASLATTAPHPASRLSLHSHTLPGVHLTRRGSSRVLIEPLHGRTSRQTAPSLISTSLSRGAMLPQAPRRTHLAAYAACVAAADSVSHAVNRIVPEPYMVRSTPPLWPSRALTSGLAHAGRDLSRSAGSGLLQR